MDEVAKKLAVIEHQLKEIEAGIRELKARHTTVYRGPPCQEDT